jgi:hypothetical protein
VSGCAKVKLAFLLFTSYCGWRRSCRKEKILRWIYERYVGRLSVRLGVSSARSRETAPGLVLITSNWSRIKE